MVLVPWFHAYKVAWTSYSSPTWHCASPIASLTWSAAHCYNHSKMENRYKALAAALAAAAGLYDRSKVETRPLILVVALALAVGLVFGGLAGAFWQTQPTFMMAQPVQLDSAAQDDFMVAVAEAYAVDGNLQLARDRLARLHWPDIPYRAERLARIYASQQDLIAHQLAGLAVSLGSTDPELIALNVHPAPDRAALLSVALPESIPASALEIPTPLSPLATATLAPSGITPKTGGSVAFAAELAAGSEPLPTPASNQPVALVQPAMPGQPNITASQPPAAPPTSVALLIEPTPTTRAPNPAPTATPKPQGPAAPLVMARRPIVGNLPVKVPDSAGVPARSIPLTARPSGCTPAGQMPAVVNQTVSLCPGQQYRPFTLKGDNITLYADRANGALVRASPHGFGITATGTNISIVGATVVAATDPADLNTWLCMYDACG